MTHEKRAEEISPKVDRQRFQELCCPLFDSFLLAYLSIDGEPVCVCVKYADWYDSCGLRQSVVFRNRVSDWVRLPIGTKITMTESLSFETLRRKKSRRRFKSMRASERACREVVRHSSLDRYSTEHSTTCVIFLRLQLVRFNSSPDWDGRELDRTNAEYSAAYVVEVKILNQWLGSKFVGV